eukprot:m.22245 g.22245  ORF g.22245 m.22245 type:complete len:134 (+) comp7379_c0_seq1:695-1096(+)
MESLKVNEHLCSQLRFSVVHLALIIIKNFGTIAVAQCKFYLQFKFSRILILLFYYFEKKKKKPTTTALSHQHQQMELGVLLFSSGHIKQEYGNLIMFIKLIQHIVFSLVASLANELVHHYAPYRIYMLNRIYN